MRKIFLLMLLLSSCNINKSLFDNGSIKEKGYVSNGIRIGKWKTFYKSGKLFQIGKYVNGKKEGVWIIYHENGKIRQFGNFKNGLASGEWKYFHKNGKIEGVGSLVKGNQNGKWIWFHANGKIYTERFWKNGKLISILSCYDRNGNKLDKGTLFNGDGTLKLYSNYGKLTKTLKYKNGVLLN